MPRRNRLESPRAIGTQKSTNTRMNIKVIAAWTIAITLLVFMAQNFETVQVSLLLWTVELPRAVMILLVFAAGILLGWLIGTLRSIGKHE